MKQGTQDSCVGSSGSHDDNITNATDDDSSWNTQITKSLTHYMFSDLKLSLQHFFPQKTNAYLMS